MSDESFGACVVLLPETNALTEAAAVEPHVTLVYLGDTTLSGALTQDLIDIVAELAFETHHEVFAQSEGFEKFGEDRDVLVLEFDPEESYTVLDIRAELISRLTPDLATIFKESETFPNYRPHMTLGVLSEGYQKPAVGIPSEMKMMSIAVWNGEDRIDFPLVESEMAHEGVSRRSGRYPWGSGDNPEQRHRSLLGEVERLRKQGLTEKEIATGLGIVDSRGQGNVATLRAKRTIALNAVKMADAGQAARLREKGLSNVAIGEIMHRNESSIRAMLDPAQRERNDNLTIVANKLKEQVERKEYLDVGKGTENHIGVSRDKLMTAVAMLKEEDYNLYYVKTKQLGTVNFTTQKVLTKPGVTYTDLIKNQDKIKNITEHSDDGGRTWTGILPPLAVNPKRVAIRYGDEGGADSDGVIQLRRGVEDISMGKARYAQVRIQVGKDHYLKGMAMYADDLPPGVDLRFNTNKLNTGNKLDAMKKLERVMLDGDEKGKPTGPVDIENPFGSIVRQRIETGKSGQQKVTSALNIVGSKDTAGEEGGWDTWSNKLSSQFLSKQPPTLAKEQLGLRYDTKKAEYDEIMALTNPAVRKKLLKSFADDADSSAVHLKAAGLPRTKSKVILPINSLKDDEVYAPTFKDGEKVVLIRHPHGGTFEIPELRVNNKNPQAKGLIQNAVDAIGINSKVAQRLSGADFDGDTVLVIPNDKGKVKTSPSLIALRDFDPQRDYKGYEGMTPMSARTKQLKMGDISNLITDMTVKGASNAELARAVKHSMVVIDAEKHKLNYKQSAKDNGINELKTRYQGSARSGATTLISRSSSPLDVPLRKGRSAKEGGPIDAVTGEKRYTPTGESYVDKTGKTVVKSFKSTKMAETNDAHTLSSGTAIESVYGNYANKMKALANEARKSDLATKHMKVDLSAKAAYKPQVDSLTAKLALANMNAPLERRAQVIANGMVKAKRDASPDMESSEVKKIQSLALTEARIRTGAAKQKIVITPLEWTAIQSGAVAPSKLDSILNNADLDQVKALATPRIKPPVNAAQLARAKSMLAGGYTQAEVAEALGLPTSTLNDQLTS